jgi:hypothetical protein
MPPSVDTDILKLKELPAENVLAATAKGKVTPEVATDAGNVLVTGVRAPSSGTDIPEEYRDQRAVAEEFVEYTVLKIESLLSALNLVTEMLLMLAVLSIVWYATTDTVLLSDLPSTKANAYTEMK